MPLKMGTSDKTFGYNMKTEMGGGKPQRQSLAIAFAKKREAEKRKKMWRGGMMADPKKYWDDDQQEENYRDDSGEDHLNDEGEDFTLKGFADGGEVEESGDQDEEEEDDDKKKNFAKAIMSSMRYR